MRVKRYAAETLQDAMLKVKMDMGKDAVILHTRKFKEGGFFGFFGKVMFEVTAAIEETAVSREALARDAARQVMPSAEPPFQAEAGRSANNVLEQEDTDEESDIYEELQEMKFMLTEMMNRIDLAQDVRDLPRQVRRYFRILSDSEVEDKIAKKLLKEVLNALSPHEISNGDTVKESLEYQIVKMFKRSKPVTFKKHGLNQQSIALVGPTGVGKTTTIAKLAATFSIVDKKKVALITADTYRVAAVEQLKTYGEIIGIPVDVVYTPQELREAISKHTDKDLILIDTAGRSHRNTEQMTELKTYIDAAEPSDIFLVLSATTRYQDMLDIVNSYSDIDISRIVFTKLDETSCFGAILSLICKTQKSLSYVTTGQNVPDDIEIADPAKIAKNIMRER